MFLRFLILGLLVYLLLVLIYSTVKRKGRGSGAKSYVPRNEAYRSHGHYFCSRECARAYAAEQV